MKKKQTNKQTKNKEQRTDSLITATKKQNQFHIFHNSQPYLGLHSAFTSSLTKQK